MSHPRRLSQLSQYDDPEDESVASGGGGGSLHGAVVGHIPPHPHRVPSQSIMPPPGGVPPRGVAMPGVGVSGPNPPPPHHLPPHHHHHPALLAAMGGGGVPPPPRPASGGGNGNGNGGGPQGPTNGAPGGGFFHPGANAFNSGLAAAIAAAEYRKQREAAAAAHAFAAAHASGVGRPAFPGMFPNYGGAAHGHPGGPPPHPPGMLFGSRGGGPGPGSGVGPQQQQQQQAAGAFLGRGGGGVVPGIVGGGPSGMSSSMSPSLLPQDKRPNFSNNGIVVPNPLDSPNIIPSSSTPHPTMTNININSNAHAMLSANNTGNNTQTILPRMPIFSNGRPELPPPRWYDASVPLGVMEDRYYLSELQCVLRSEFVEAFGTTETDTVLPVHGRNRPIALGQVGIRCQHCKDILPTSPSPSPNNDQNRNRSTQNAISYPSFISGIYNTVQQMYRLHFDLCPHIPDELKERVANLKDSHTSNRGGRKQYWMESAKRIGLVDTSFGIHYGRDPEEPLPALGGMQRTSTVGNTGDDGDEYSEWGVGSGMGLNGSPLEGGDGSGHGGALMPAEEIEIYPLVVPEDKPLISDYLYLALEQMQPCNLMDADRVGCYKGRRTGFPGLACRHCIGQAGCGRYFPASEASLSQTTTSQTIVNHVRNCRRCPLEIREQLELMKRAKTCPDYKKSDKPKHGGRKVFFHRLWCRIQRIPLPKNEKSSCPGNEDKEYLSLPPSKKKTIASEAASPERKKRKKSADSAENDARKSVEGTPTKTNPGDAPSNDSDSEENDIGAVVETVKFDNVHRDIKTAVSSSSSTTRAATATAAENSLVIYQGRTRLTRGDDPHWLSEADGFIRQELTEVFTAQEEDLDLFGDPEIGQVGVRCFYCAENNSPDDRSRGHIYYPSSVGCIQQAVSDLQRRHLGMCSEIPEGMRESFRSMKGYGAKPKGDTTQYWMDAAKELGLHDSHEGQGISFFRNPLDKSPADEIDAENNDNAPTGSILVPTEDRQKCTDQMLLLMKQFEPCQFRTSDRKSSRSRDRALGFPGLVCIHCNQKRYFPISEKKLQDSLSLMTTHIHNCFHAPLDVKASLCYLQHRSLLQKQELPGQWKFTFFKGVWNRLHQHHGTEVDADPSAVDDAVKESECKEEAVKVLPEGNTPAAEDISPVEEELNTTDSADEEGKPILYNTSNVALEEQDHAEALRDMKDLIKSAALWLSERDAEYEARARGGRGKGSKRR